MFSKLIPVVLTLVSFTQAAVIQSRAQFIGADQLLPGSLVCSAGTANSITVGDIQSSISAVRNNAIGGSHGGLKFPVFIPCNACVSGFGDEPQPSFTTGSLKVDFNVHPSGGSSTHIDNGALADALQLYQTTCCGEFPTCIGAEFSLAGNTGLVVDISVVAI